MCGTHREQICTVSIVEEKSATRGRLHIAGCWHIEKIADIDANRLILKGFASGVEKTPPMAFKATNSGC